MCQVAVKKMGYSGATVAWFLEVNDVNGGAELQGKMRLRTLNDTPFKMSLHHRPSFLRLRPLFRNCCVLNLLIKRNTQNLLTSLYFCNSMIKCETEVSQIVLRF